MSPKTTGWDELHLAENRAVELLESLDYTYLPPEALEGERKSFKETILTLRLAKILKQLNPWLSETNVAKAVKTVTHVAAASLAEANEKVYTSLTYGIALEQDLGDGRKSHTVRFFDFDRPDRNEWIVTRQYKVLGSKKHIVPDVVVFVNGLPLAVIERKSPTIGDAWKAKAIQQLHRYQEAGTQWKDQGAPRLFEVAQILVGTCGERAVYGTVGTPERFFLKWKEPYPLSMKHLGERLEREPSPQDVLLYGLLEHSLVQTLLDTALDPMLDRTEAEAKDPAKTLLRLSVDRPSLWLGPLSSGGRKAHRHTTRTHPGRGYAVARRFPPCAPRCRALLYPRRGP